GLGDILAEHDVVEAGVAGELAAVDRAVAVEVLVGGVHAEHRLHLRRVRPAGDRHPLRAPGVEGRVLRQRGRLGVALQRVAVVEALDPDHRRRRALQRRAVVH
ncbi:MAG: hypothetical protein ACK559_31385, partial [bacterium]